jgi:hypothetical protein
MSNAASRLSEFVLSQLAAQPVSKRIALYRDLAQVAANPKEAKRFTRIADDLQAIERSHAQLILDFKRRAS